MASSSAESAHDEFLVGSHCCFPECSKLDFLPFRCDKCNQIFCLDHRLPSSHNCVQPTVTVASDEPAVQKLHPCSFPDCSNREVVQIECGRCRKSYCLAHRHADDHQCPGDSDVPSGKTVPSFQLPETVIKPVQPPSVKAFNPQNPTAVRLRRMKLKTSAVGEKGISEEDRLFVEIVLLDGSSRAVYLHKEWSVGRALDGLKRFLKLDVKYDEAKLREKESGNEITSSALVKDAFGDGMLLELHR